MWNKEVTDADIYVVNIDGSHPINLIQRPDCWDTHPAWSPDGRQIAFKSNRDGGSHLFVMNPDGTGIRNLTIGAGLPPVGCSLPSWSPDSRQIAFTADLTLLFTINADGTDLKQLPVNAWDTAWSPDGRLLAFTSSRDGPASDIYLLNLQSNEVKRLTKTGGQNIFNQYPSWLPDGNGLLFTSSRDLTAVWYMEADGSHQKRVWRESHGHLILMPRILPNPQAILRQEKDWTTWGTIKTRLYE
jgi:Tol biopolymer transport system component